MGPRQATYELRPPSFATTYAVLLLLIGVFVYCCSQVNVDAGSWVPALFGSVTQSLKRTTPSAIELWTHFPAGTKDVSSWERKVIMDPRREIHITGAVCPLTERAFIQHRL